jgi:hypothetical protein
MSRTIRRKHVPAWVCEDWGWYTYPETGVTVYGARRQLQGEELAGKLRWWHEDKSRYWGVRPPKHYRQRHEARHRMATRTALAQHRKEPEYPVQLARKPKLGFWN